jgi:hypothetical protein
MTPKETAEELTLRYYKLGEHLYIPISFAKQCALIAVDEIRDNLPLISEIQQRWIEVKQEIKKL